MAAHVLTLDRTGLDLPVNPGVLVVAPYESRDLPESEKTSLLPVALLRDDGEVASAGIRERAGAPSRTESGEAVTKALKT